MGLMSMDMNLDDRDVKRGINRLVRSGRDLRPVFTALKKPFKDDIKAHRKRKEGADGPLAPRVDSTRTRDKNSKTVKLKGGKTRTFKRRRKQQILGKLPTSVTTKANSRSFIGISKVPWAMAHQEGATVGNGTVLPARPFLFLSEPFMDRVDREVLDHLEDGWKS